MIRIKDIVSRSLGAGDVKVYKSVLADLNRNIDKQITFLLQIEFTFNLQ